MAKGPRYGEIGTDAPLRTLADAVLCALWDAVFSESREARAGVDVEAVHDMRVAIRRLRSALRTFRDCYPHRRLRRLSKSSRRLGRQLGIVRDADVHLAVLRAALSEASQMERDGVAFAIEQVGEQRGRALAEFCTLLDDFDRNALSRMLAHA